MKRDQKKSLLLLQIYREIQLYGPVLRQDLLRKFELPPRTLERYIQDLAELGVTSQKDVSDPRKKSYSLLNPVDGLRLNESQVLSLALASALLRPIAPRLGQSLYGLIPKGEAKQVPKDCISVYFAGLNLGVVNLENKIFLIMEAIQKGKPLLVDSECFWPQNILLHEGKWVVSGSMIREKKSVIGSFRLDQTSMQRAVSETQLKPYNLEPFNPSYGPNPTENEVRVLLRIHNWRGQKYLKKEQWHPTQKIVSEDSIAGTMDIQFEVNDLRYFKFFVRRWLPHAEVLEPSELREQICQELVAAQKLYGL
ncbi:MAG: WYL domain-containing protein [Candidatus Cloacimonetes bacterium]|nr:WYL domain-containing protein [Candidatus Cloacimonadota bacterium]